MLTNQILMLCGYFVACFVGIVILLSIRRRYKGDMELVEIIGENGIKICKKYPIKENKVLIEPPKVRGRGHSGWTPEFSKDAFLYYVGGNFLFKKLKRKLMVKDGASKCIEFYGKDAEKIPFYDRETAKKLFEAEVIKHAGATTQKIGIPLFVYLLLFLLLMIGIVNILFTSGRIHF